MSTTVKSLLAALLFPPPWGGAGGWGGGGALAPPRPSPQLPGGGAGAPIEIKDIHKGDIQEDSTQIYDSSLKLPAQVPF